MASRYYSEFPERKLPRGGKGATPRAGKPGAKTSGGTIQERTAKWPDPGPHWKGSFNSKTKAPVVKTRPAKGGID